MINNFKFSVISGKIKGLEKIWLIGDEFGFKTCQEHYRNRRDAEGLQKMYAYEFFEVKEFFTSKYSNGQSRNVLKRLHNSLIFALNEYHPLPRLIVLVLDEDIIKGVTAGNTTADFDIVLRFLFRNFDRAIEIYKENLPSKAKRPHIPHFLWMAPPTHKNFTEDSNVKRRNFTSSLETVASQFKNCTVLKMIKAWDHDDGESFLNDAQRYSFDGLNKYWQSVDAAIRFWFTALSKKMDKKSKPKKKFQLHRRFDNDHKSSKYHNIYKLDNRARNQERRRKLPTPPPSKY